MLWTHPKMLKGGVGGFGGGGVAEFEEFQIVPYRLQESLDIEFTGVKHKPLQIYIPPFKKTLY